MLPARQKTWKRIFVGTKLSLKSMQPHFKSEEDCDAFGDRSTQRGATSESLGVVAPGSSSHMSSHSEELVQQTPDTISIKLEEDIGGGLPAGEDCDAFRDRSNQRNATSEILGEDAPGSSHMASHSEELKILSVYGKGEGPLAVDGHNTLFTASEVEALNLLSADHSAAKSLERGERLVCHEELSVQPETPDTISIKVEEDIGGGMPAVEDVNDIRDCSTQRGATSESLGVDAPGSSHMSSHSGELRILSVYGKGEGPLAVDGWWTVSPNNANMIVHMRTRPDEKPYGCDQCTKSFSQKGNLKIHMSTHSGEKPYRCDQCAKHYSHSYTLKMHMRTHTGEKPHRCDQCRKRFSLSEHLKGHMKTHTWEKPYSCDHCKKRFARHGDLNVHMRTHSGEKPYKCDQCTKSFSQKGHLKTHMRTHSGEKPYKCDQCTKHFSQTRGLKTHMRTHSGVKPYKCDQCTMRFSQKGTLKIHMRTHSKEKSYKCDQCTKCFSLKGNLKTHMRTHSGEKPYKCDQCTKRFSRNRGLKIHMRTHTGENPYRCDQCTKGFSLKGTLKIHMKTHSG
ncbi:zinc finger protein 25-like isoform X1 [Gadus chalcogrammus]|uniref:zinc finger protein 25-like isoform X1 n=1 Tax=Gadus chalcogrammus TaxID=1042646 RepID=UPI0024C3F8B4|nr:zinc finger protein 25-like isoform X1 [Gadus chalcogrammus]